MSRITLFEAKDKPLVFSGEPVERMRGEGVGRWTGGISRACRSDARCIFRLRFLPERFFLWIVLARSSRSWTFILAAAIVIVGLLVGFFVA